jgi:hypothetical protein
MRLKLQTIRAFARVETLRCNKWAPSPPQRDIMLPLHRTSSETEAPARAI